MGAAPRGARFWLPGVLLAVAVLLVLLLAILMAMVGTMLPLRTTQRLPVSLMYLRKMPMAL